MKFRNWFSITEAFEPNAALLVIDMQNDFIDSKFAAPDAKSLLPKVNSLITKARSQGIPVIFTAHVYKADSPDTLARPPEKRYCIINTFGADFHSDLDRKDSPVFNKDTFSGFGGKNRDNEKESLANHLHKHGIKRVIIVGLTLDYCVAATAQEAKRNGFEAAVVMDATKGMYDYHTHDQTVTSLKSAGIKMLPTL